VSDVFERNDAVVDEYARGLGTAATNQSGVASAVDNRIFRRELFDAASTCE